MMFVIHTIQWGCPNVHYSLLYRFVAYTAKTNAPQKHHTSLQKFQKFGCSKYATAAVLWDVNKHNVSIARHLKPALHNKRQCIFRTHYIKNGTIAIKVWIYFSAKTIRCITTFAKRLFRQLTFAVVKMNQAISPQFLNLRRALVKWFRFTKFTTPGKAPGTTRTPSPPPFPTEHPSSICVGRQLRRFVCFGLQKRSEKGVLLFRSGIKVKR